jgi:hypothetical protein
MRSGSGTSSLTMPHRYASCAAISFPVRIYPLAMDSGMRLARRCTPPVVAATTPTPGSGSPKRACSVAIRMSHASAIANPPPEAMPLIAAIRGFELLVHFSNPPNPPSGCGPVGRPLSAVYFRSLPAETDPLPIASLRYKKSQYVFPSFAPPCWNMRWPLHVGIFCHVRQRPSCVHVGRFGALYIASKRTAALPSERRGWGAAPYAPTYGSLWLVHMRV